MSRQSAVAAGVLSLGDHTYGDPSVIRFPGDEATVEIGRYCAIGDGSEFMVGGNHRTGWVTTYPLRIMLGLPGALEDGHPVTRGPIVVGNDVRIGSDVLVLSGVRVGNGAALGVGALASRDVRPYAVVAGNPAREIRRRFADEIIAGLCRIAWWDWPDQLVRERVAELCNPDVASFVGRYDPDPGVD